LEVTAISYKQNEAKQVERSKLVAFVDYEVVTKQVITLACYVSFSEECRHLIGFFSTTLMLFHEHG